MYFPISVNCFQKKYIQPWQYSNFLSLEPYNMFVKSFQSDPSPQASTNVKISSLVVPHDAIAMYSFDPLSFQKNCKSEPCNALTEAENFQTFCTQWPSLLSIAMPRPYFANFVIQIHIYWTWGMCAQNNFSHNDQPTKSQFVDIEQYQFLPSWNSCFVFACPTFSAFISVSLWLMYPLASPAHLATERQLLFITF